MTCAYIRNYGGPNGTWCKLKKLLQIKYSCSKENKVASNWIKLLQIWNSCCKFSKRVAANLKKECFSQLKHQKCACALKEGAVGTGSFIFLSGKLLYFFPDLCDYSDKFPKMFCSSCGMECPSTAISVINVVSNLI